MLLKKTKKKTVSLILAIFLLITSVIFVACDKEKDDDDFSRQGNNNASAEFNELPQPLPPPPLYHIAVGDSIAAGFGVDEKDRYPDLLFALLQADGQVNVYENIAVSGYTTAMLLAQLRRMDEAALARFAEARVITISIGGNNILSPFVANLPDVETITQLIADVNVIATEAMKLADIVGELDEDIKRMREGFQFSDLFRISDILDLASTLLDESAVIIDLIGKVDANNPLNILSGPPSDELAAELEQGILDFAAEFAEVMAWMRENAPLATVIVNTVYNPLPDEFFSLEIGMSHYIDAYIRRINTIIRRERAAHGYLVADVYTVFDEEEDKADLLNYHLNMEEMYLNFDIIHPNEKGHRMITELCYEAFVE
ncbi:MAG: SGNH/GDSL hydrolase family protein [Lachnospiraceae bacterium]|jgi:lysophospholipase L1-like esterase|nr:SGNH/GDSL hydrolase family protein [Lachnospiraceae bacterium]